MPAKNDTKIKNTVIYSIEAFCKIPFKGTTTKFIESPDAIFWENHEHLTKKRGCYIFCIKTSNGMIPYYVGKASKSFKQEVFTAHKKQIYNSVLHEYGKGIPVLFFVSAPISKGIFNGKILTEIEEFLIEISLTRNPYLKNIQKTKPKKWAIRGINEKKKQQGKIPIKVQDFKKMLGINLNQIS